MLNARRAPLRLRDVHVVGRLPERGVAALGEPDRLGERERARVGRRLRARGGRRQQRDGERDAPRGTRRHGRRPASAATFSTTRTRAPSVSV
jgi:hypothetical protein